MPSEGAHGRIRHSSAASQPAGYHRATTEPPLPRTEHTSLSSTARAGWSAAGDSRTELPSETALSWGCSRPQRFAGNGWVAPGCENHRLRQSRTGSTRKRREAAADGQSQSETGRIRQCGPHKAASPEGLGSAVAGERGGLTGEALRSRKFDTPSDEVRGPLDGLVKNDQ